MYSHIALYIFKDVCNRNTINLICSCIVMAKYVKNLFGKDSCPLCLLCCIIYSGNKKSQTLLVLFILQIIQISILHTDFNIAYRFQYYIQISILHTDFNITYRFQYYIQTSILHTDFNIAYRFQYYIQTSILHTDFDIAYRFQYYIQISILHTYFNITY